jgi:hypothetical protein
MKDPALPSSYGYHQNRDQSWSRVRYFVLLAYDLPSTCSQYCDVTVIEGSLHRTSDSRRFVDISPTPWIHALAAAIKVDNRAAETNLADSRILSRDQN